MILNLKNEDPLLKKNAFWNPDFKNKQKNLAKRSLSRNSGLHTLTSNAIICTLLH